MADISLDFQFNSPIEKVWDALTTSESLAQWVMANNFKPIEGYKCQFRDDKIDLIVDCEVLVVDKPKKLSYTWVGGPINTIVTWTLKQEDGKTQLHLEHTGFDKEDFAFKGAKSGWTYKVGELQNLLND